VLDPGEAGSVLEGEVGEAADARSSSSEAR